jgi:hypothetical protein
MNQEFFDILLNTLQPRTLAYMLVDLEEAAADWEYYPEAAPGETTRTALERIRLTIANTGQALAKAEGLNFDKLMDETRDEREADDWLLARNEWDRKNWYQDYA